MKEKLGIQEGLRHLDAVQQEARNNQAVIVYEQPHTEEVHRRDYRPIPESEWHVPSVPFVPYKPFWEQGFADQHRWHGVRLSKSARNMKNILKEKG